jgi:hypothetical protein
MQHRAGGEVARRTGRRVLDEWQMNDQGADFSEVP